MKFKTFFKNFVAILVLMAFALTASAQRGHDAFQVPRVLNLTVQSHTGGTGIVTNGPYDVRMFDGISKIDISSTTNTAASGGTLTVQIYGSSDQTNLTALGSYALGVNKSIIYTNTYYPASLTATDKFVLPGTYTVPSASVAFVSPYIAPAQFTNSGALTITTPGLYEIGFNSDDALRYLYVVYTPGGSVTNFSTSAVLTGFVHDSNTQ